MKFVARLTGTRLALLLALDQAAAHTAGTAFLSLRELDDSTIRAEWDFDIRDLNQQLAFDENGDAAVTWGEIVSARPALEALVLARTRLSVAGGECSITTRELPALAEYRDGPYLRFTFTFYCPAAGEALALDYSRWLELDAAHRALIEYEARSGRHVQGILSSAGSRWQLSESPLARLKRFMVEGARHLVTGYDHLAFLGVLLLALVRRPHGGDLLLRETLRRAFAVVTAFTFAHSLTLGLAATGRVALPEQPVEVTIAASVMFAAMLNLRRQTAHHGWKLAFVFGLVHGLGFAGALTELAGERIDLLALAAFNIGIELAQLAIAAVAVPLMWVLFRNVRHERVGVPLASLGIACVAAVWVGARVAGQ